MSFRRTFSELVPGCAAALGHGLTTGSPSLGVQVCAFILCLHGLATNSPALGQTNYAVVPVGYDNIEGNGHAGAPFNVGIDVHYQQMYSASQFQGLGDNLLITELRFRVNSLDSAFDKVLPTVDIRLSTSTRSPEAMSLELVQNVGQNETVVFAKGPLHLSSQKAGFDVVVPLTTPFLYIPSEGSLLMDVRKFDNSTIRSDLDLQFYTKLQGSPMASIEGIGEDATFGVVVESSGLVTKFGYEVVPEPRTYAFLGLGLLGVLVYQTAASLNPFAKRSRGRTLGQKAVRSL